MEAEFYERTNNTNIFRMLSAGGPHTQGEERWDLSRGSGRKLHILCRKMKRTYPRAYLCYPRASFSPVSKLELLARYKQVFEDYDTKSLQNLLDVYFTFFQSENNLQN